MRNTPGRVTSSRTRAAAREEPHQIPEDMVMHASTGYSSGYGMPPYPFEAGGSSWHATHEPCWEAAPPQPVERSWLSDSSAQWERDALLSSDSSGMPPPVGARHSYSGRDYHDYSTDMAALNQRVENINIHTSEINSSLTQHIHETHQWQQQASSQLSNIHASMIQQQGDWAAYYRAQGFNLYRGP